MESLLWAIDLLLVAGLCIWAVREDTPIKRVDTHRTSHDNKDETRHVDMNAGQPERSSHDA